MDAFKLQKKFKITKNEVRSAAAEQTDEFIDLIEKPIPDPLEYERVLNLKDFQLRTLMRAGILNDDNRSMYFVIVFKAVVEQYWKQIDLPENEREIYTNSYTDDGLKKVQQQYLKLLRSKAKTYKHEIDDWWMQRKARMHTLQNLYTKNLMEK